MNTNTNTAPALEAIDVTDQTSQELRAHMRRLKAMHGWHEPLADRLFKEVLSQDEEIKRLRQELALEKQEGKPCEKP